MSTEVDKLRAAIATADQRIAALEKRPGLTSTVKHQIAKAKDSVRDMRIQLAGMADLRDNPCPHCGTLKTHSFLVCMPCWRDVPFKLWAFFKGAQGLHHNGKVGASYLKAARDQIFSHLQQHSTAIV